MFVTVQHRTEVVTQDQFRLLIQDECLTAMTANGTWEQNESIICINKILVLSVH